MADGSRHSVHYVKNTGAYGAAVATPAWLELRQSGCTLNRKDDQLDSTEATEDRQVIDVASGMQKCEGDVKAQLTYDSYKDLLEACFCGTWTAGKLKAGTTRRDFNILRKFADITDFPYHLYLGTEISKMQFNLKANAVIELTLSMIAREQQILAAAPADSTFTAAPTTRMITSFGSGSLFQEGGNALALVTDLSFTLDNGQDRRPVVCSDKTLQPSIRKSKGSGTLTIYNENGAAAIMNKFLNRTESVLYFTTVDPAGNKYKWTFPRIKYTGATVDTNGDDTETMVLPFTMLKDSVTGTNIQVEEEDAA